MKAPVLIYGAYGFTAKLVIQELASSGIPLLLAGRNEQKLKLASPKIPRLTFDLDDHEKLESALKQCSMVLNCAGPFSHTAQTLAWVAIEAGVHYVDITGEVEVFEQLKTLDHQARQNQVMILPGAGFDVVPSDCLAARLKQELPDADRLIIAFGSKAGSSAGTMKTAVEGLHKGGLIRHQGKLKRVPHAYHHMMFNFGEFNANAVTIPWGDLSTAYTSTGIPNIETYMIMSPSMIRRLKLLNLFAWLLSLGVIRKMTSRQIEKQRPSLEKAALQANQANFCGMAFNKAGQEIRLCLRTPNGYRLTAKTAALIVQKIYAGNFKPGYQTPSMAYGANFIDEFEEVKWL